MNEERKKIEWGSLKCVLQLQPLCLLPVSLNFDNSKPIKGNQVNSIVLNNQRQNQTSYAEQVFFVSNQIEVSLVDSLERNILMELVISFHSLL